MALCAAHSVVLVRKLAEVSQKSWPALDKSSGSLVSLSAFENTSQSAIGLNQGCKLRRRTPFKIPKRVGVLACKPCRIPAFDFFRPWVYILFEENHLIPLTALFGARAAGLRVLNIQAIRLVDLSYDGMNYAASAAGR